MTNITLECKEGYVLKCLASASYGNTAGSCSEVDSNANGCGIAFEKRADVNCDYDNCVDSSIEVCTEKSEILHREIEIDYNTSCDNCLAICECGFSDPLFYNVADCFGEGSSTICTGKDTEEDELEVDTMNTYLPQEVWDNDCVGKKECYLALEGEDYTCTEDDETQVYYTGVNGYEFARFQEVAIDNHMSECEKMNFKILGVCEAV